MELADFLAKLDVSQTAVAEAIGITQATISRIAARKQRPDGDTLLRIQRWADTIARQQQINPADWLSWEWVTDAQAEPAA
jgi:plasmid maintenance system antidote protein VapI